MIWDCVLSIHTKASFLMDASKKFIVTANPSLLALDYLNENVFKEQIYPPVVEK